MRGGGGSDTVPQACLGILLMDGKCQLQDLATISYLLYSVSGAGVALLKEYRDSKA